MTVPSQDDLASTFSNVLSDGEPKISPGDYYDIDKYVLFLEHLGYDVDYENLVSEGGFIAQVTINGEDHAVWRGGIEQVDHMVYILQKPLDRFEKTE